MHGHTHVKLFHYEHYFIPGIGRGGLMWTFVVHDTIVHETIFLTVKRLIISNVIE